MCCFFFYGVKGRRRRMKTKTDLKSPRFGDIVGNSTQLNTALISHDNPIFKASSRLTLFNQFSKKKINPGIKLAIIDKIPNHHHKILLLSSLGLIFNLGLKFRYSFFLLGF